MARRKEITEMDHLADTWELILDNIYSGIIYCDNKCHIVSMNQVYAELARVDRKEVVGKPIGEMFPNCPLPRVLKTGKVEFGQKCNVNGGAPLIVNRIPIRRGGVTVGIICQSITRDYATFEDLVTRLHLLESRMDECRSELNSLLSARYTFDDIKGESSSILEAKSISARYAQSDAPVLLRGATGTGKELFAHAIHLASKRSEGPFVCVNCAAIPKDLLESELFGYAPGAFTGASKKGKAGKLELAHRGTLFLDEIGDLPLSAQAKLLRVLESKRLERVGDLRPIEVDFRLIAATNKDLRGMIERNEFREEFFYRLNTMTVHIPQLSERKEDIPLLVNDFLDSMGKSGIRCTINAMGLLKRYSWPGNVRELRNAIERAISLIDRNVMDVEHLPSEIITLHCPVQHTIDSPNRLLSKEIFRCEHGILIEALKLTKGNMAKSSKLLGISRSTLYEKCKRHNLLYYNWVSSC